MDLALKLAMLAAGGALGTIARYGIGEWVGSQLWARGLPIGTFIINVSGSFILGVAFVIVKDRLPPEYGNWYLLIGTGFCGGFTTFSTFELETFNLVRDGSWWLALANIVASVVAGFLGVLIAINLTGTIFPKD